MRSSYRLIVLLLAALGAGACSSATEPAHFCTLSFRFGLTVTVVDSVGGAPPASAILIARSGTFVDSVGPEPSSPTELRLLSAGEHAGIYDLVVRSSGYRDWTLTGLEIPGDECHVGHVDVTAKLQR